MDESQMPLIVTADDALLEDSLRFCAAVGATPVVASDIQAARKSWRIAPAILVGTDLAPTLARTDPVRREGVVVVGRPGPDVWQAAVALGAEQVCELPVHEDDVVEILANVLEGKGEACIVSVVGGCGGVGTTTLCASLALEGAEQHMSTLLLDADPLGGGIDLVLGQEDAEGMRWGDLDVDQGPSGHYARISGESLRQALPDRAGVSTLSWDREVLGELTASAVRSVASAASRSFDLVVVDLPRDGGEIMTEVLGRSQLTVLLTAEDIHGLAAARRMLEVISRSTSKVAVATRSKRAGIGPTAVAEALSLPILARIKHDRRVSASIDAGDGPGRSRTLTKSSLAILEVLGMSR